MAISYFSSSSVADGSNVVSHINKDQLVTAIQNDYSDSYFDSTDKINKVYVYYTDSGNRQLRTIIHGQDGTNLLGNISWSSYAMDGTWQKIRMKAYTADGASHILTRAIIGANEDIVHNAGIMTLNIE